MHIQPVFLFSDSFRGHGCRTSSRLPLANPGTMIVPRLRYVLGVEENKDASYTKYSVWSIAWTLPVVWMWLVDVLALITS